MNSDESEILLVEDGGNEADPTRHAWPRENLAHHLASARPGEDSLELRFCRGAFAGGSSEPRSRLLLLALQLPAGNGIEGLQQIKGHDRPRAYRWSS
jgi:hypothetical protein